MTVRQNLAYGPRMRGAPKAEIDRRVDAIAELLQLTPLLDRNADRLSVNILQRVAIGRSAILEPAIFLLDEPLSNVDAAFRAVMRTELKHLQRQFRQTMVYVTHDQLEAMTMADRIAVMDHGVLQQVGTPLEVYNNPANVFVARFIGAPGMNLLRARLRRATAAWSSTSGRSARRRRCPTGSPPRCAAPRRRCSTASGRRRRARARPGPRLAGHLRRAHRRPHDRPSRRRRDGGEGRLRQRCRPGRRRDGHRCARPGSVRLFDAATGRALGGGLTWPRSPFATSPSASATRSLSTTPPSPSPTTSSSASSDRRCRESRRSCV